MSNSRELVANVLQVENVFWPLCFGRFLNNWLPESFISACDIDYFKKGGGKNYLKGRPANRLVGYLCQHIVNDLGWNVQWDYLLEPFPTWD